MTHINYRVKGIVQGVGFRPFVYLIAKRYNLKGFILNDSVGVEISLQGTIDDINLFERAFYDELPPLARVDTFEKVQKPLEDFLDFKIIESQNLFSKSSLVSPDFAMCKECYNEINSKEDRRHNYFFTNCTNCGPRYSIIKTVPYDRPNTSMDIFEMCEECESEYKNPEDRRYHAQPISCAKCGPTLSLKSIDGDVISKNNEAINDLAKLIEDGHIVCMKGMGGFHLMCDATNEKTIKHLREQKRRPTKPFAVMFNSLESITEIANTTDKENKKITSNERPIVLVKKDAKNYNLSNLIAPKIDRIGVFLPYTPLHILLLNKLKSPIIATSANHSGEPIIKDERELVKKLGSIVEYYLDYNREILNATDDSVIQVIKEKELIMRASRGITPLGVKLESSCKKSILAVGAHQKNAIALYINNQIIQSPYIGDLDNISTVEFFERTIETFKKFYNFEPDIILGDKHPLYESTKWAKSRGKEFVQIQHHYAHICSCLFEHDIDEEVLGVAWDGTGYGDDGSIWGGEFFLCDSKEYTRVCSFEPFLLLGGDASIKDIKRIALSISLDQEYVKEFEEIEKLFSKSELSLLKQVHKKSLNSPKCSSVGRLFDAVAVICGICKDVSYDGESGLLLESFYDSSIEEKYDFTVENGIIKYKHTLVEMINDKNPTVIASKFINSLVFIVKYISEIYDRKVLLSGGVFQNRTLLELLIDKIPNLYFQEKFPINDGGIAIGQVFHYINRQKTT